MEISYYLAHPAGSVEKMKNWQRMFEEKSKVKIINPFEGERPVNADWYYKQGSPHNIVTGDLNLIKKAGGLIAIVDGNISYGTIQEMVYGKQLKKPVYSVISNGHHNHPFLQYHSDEVFTSLQDLEGYLIQDCQHCDDGVTHLVGRNDKLDFLMYLCMDCDKSWMKINKEPRNDR